MSGAIAKSFYAENIGVKPEDLIVVSVMPCQAKKYEAARPEFAPNGIRLFYYEKDNYFGATAKDGAVKTFLRPDRGIRYWNRQ